MRPALTPDIVAAGLNAYVGWQVNELHKEKRFDLEQLLTMCDPSFDWARFQVQPDGPDKILKDLFIDPKENFYRATPGVQHHHIPELQHALRRILLLWLIQEKINNKKLDKLDINLENSKASRLG